MTGGGETYRLPNDHLSTVAVYYVTGSNGQWLKLREMMAQEYHWYSGSGTGYADGYSLQSDYIRFVPFPSSGQTYKMVYIPQNPDLTDKTDSYPVDVICPAGDVRGHLAARERMREKVVEWSTLRSMNTMRSPMVDDQLDWGDYGDSYLPWRRG